MLKKLMGQVRHSWANWAEIRFVAITVLTITGVLVGGRHWGGLQILELLAYDQLMRWREDEPTDPRLLLVTITEDDLRAQQRWPIPDSAIAQALARLQSYQPRAIGIDIYRDFPVPPGHEQLVAQLEKPNLVAIRSIDTLSGTPAPPEVPPERVGFNDLALDPDGVVRRNILFSEAKDGTIFSFSLRLALAYLQGEGIFPKGEEGTNYLKLGDEVFVPLQPESGGYQNIDAQGYQILLNYRSRQNFAREVTLSQVLYGSIDPNWVRDKVVLMGSTAPSLKDTHFIPYSPGLSESRQMAGVVIHAQMVSQILDAATGERPLFWYWSEKQEIFWIIVWVLLGGIVAWWFRHPLTISLLVSGCLVILSGSGFYLFTRSGWVPLATPALGFIFTVGTVLTYQSYQDRQQHKIVMKLLGQNTSPEIAEALWQKRDRLLESGKLPGVQLTATMLFLDLKGFSTISEQMAPSDLLDWLNQLLEVITHEVLSHHGVVNKFTGDGVMAVFGVPMSRQHKQEVLLDAQRAVECAVAIAEHLEAMNQNWRSLGLPTIQMRIGIFTGPVVVGSLGGKDRLEYGVLGDSVNTAARLEACEKDRQPNNCRILIAKETLVFLEDKFKVESWGLLALKGKKQMVDVYLVLGRR
ncbi:CHASE2 domain-containing protein [Oscillatoria salina]|uniref:CHASE2 domain-containing protein n=1 Tax=Oscillatoria salina TaxID=331517 RepID=UPI001CCE82EC|nr:adenylate/guanylate cyclase domain-containing protein [Oscillatoria salina]MBZ8178597.1 adenylate/guanylate cyclase domain-containing protein [Oscillatoria salina IIICB1]